MRAAQLGRYRRGLVELAPIYAYNSEYVRRSIRHAAALGLRAFRLSTDVFPLLDVAPGARSLVPGSAPVRRAARQAGMHLSNHPSQFVVLSTPRADVLANSLGALESVGWTMDHFGAGGSITLHGGGVYGDRQRAGQRLATHLGDVAPAARRRLALENDEHSWTVPELLEATRGAVPIVFDRLHWEANARSAPYAAELEAAIASWPAGRIPEVHYSEQAEGKRRGTHADHVSGRPLLRFLEELAEVSGGREIVVIVEAKKKELAIARAVAELHPREAARMRELVPGLRVDAGIDLAGARATGR